MEAHADERAVLLEDPELTRLAGPESRVAEAGDGFGAAARDLRLNDLSEAFLRGIAVDCAQQQGLDLPMVAK